MSEIILHIGLHKTGSTFLQREIFPNYENTEYLSRPFTQCNHEFNRLQYADDSLFDPKKLNELIKSIKNQKLILSDESFAGKLMGYNYINRTMIASRLANSLKNFNTKVIIFIRGQKSIMASVYNQWIKSNLRGDRTIDEFFWTPSISLNVEDLKKHGNGNEAITDKYLYFNTNKTYVHMDSFKYLEIIKLYKSLFKEVEVVLYEDFQLNQESVLNRIDKIVGAPRISHKYSSTKKANISIPISELYKRMMLNRYENFTSQVPLTQGIIKLILRGKSKAKKEFESIHQTFLHESAKYYVENNSQLIHEFPEVNIQNFPQSYLSTH